MSKKQRVKKLSKKVIFFIVLAAIIGTILLTCLGLQIAFIVADTLECWQPDYEKQDITPLLEKETLTEEDYATLYAQTGLTQTGIDRCLKKGSAGVARILAIQDDYFTVHEVTNVLYCPYVCTDFVEKYITNCYLEDGDILVTSSTHISGWRLGHAGLVTDGANGKVIQANAYGIDSYIGTVRDFTNRINFIILSPKMDADLKSEIAAYAAKNLTGLPYNALTGIFTNKTQISATQCAHLVWYSYYLCGYDLDSNGGGLVTPQDLANSPYVEVVQVFGFDPVSLWR